MIGTQSPDGITIITPADTKCWRNAVVQANRQMAERITGISQIPPPSSDVEIPPEVAVGIPPTKQPKKTIRRKTHAPE